MASGKAFLNCIERRAFLNLLDERAISLWKKYVINLDSIATIHSLSWVQQPSEPDIFIYLSPPHHIVKLWKSHFLSKGSLLPRFWQSYLSPVRFCWVKPFITEERCWRREEGWDKEHQGQTYFHAKSLSRWALNSGVSGLLSLKPKCLLQDTIWTWLGKAVGEKMGKTWLLGA